MLDIICFTVMYINVPYTVIECMYDFFSICILLCLSLFYGIHLCFDTWYNDYVITRRHMVGLYFVYYIIKYQQCIWINACSVLYKVDMGNKINALIGLIHVKRTHQLELSLPNWPSEVGPQSLCNQSFWGIVLSLCFFEFSVGVMTKISDDVIFV